MTSRAGQFLRRRQGSASVEFAFGVPALLAFFITIAEVANLIFLSATLENAVLHASRYGITGAQTGTAATRIDRVLEIIEEQTFGQIPSADLTVETLVFSQFSDIGQAEPFADENGNGTYDEGEAFSDINGNAVWDSDIGTAGLGGAGDIVLYRVRYVPPSLTGFGDWAMNSIELSAAVAVRNEPF
ncbi:MAG: TadE/TadG family type IV pilus assembly protein [Alphaproteobacteria bacterium]